MDKIERLKAKIAAMKNKRQIAYFTGRINIEAAKTVEAHEAERAVAPKAPVRTRP
jgi:hypothetical protein